MDIASLETGWKTSLAQKAEFVKRILEGPASPLGPWVDKVYPGAVKATSLLRLAAFRDIALSLQRDKFFDFISAAPRIFSNDVNASRAAESKYLLHVLPRVCVVRSQLALDDGRHRSAALLALGVKRFPVVRCEFVPSTVRCDLAPDFYQLFLSTLLKFSSSQEWLAYKGTDCYKLIFSDNEEHGLFSEHFVLSGSAVE